MLDRLGIKCRRPEIIAPLYEQCLATLGIVLVRRHSALKAVTFEGPSSPIRLWVGEGSADRKAQAGEVPFRYAFGPDTPAPIDASHQTGMRLSARDTGPPGQRRATSYEALLFDPEGDTIEAIRQTERLVPSAGSSCDCRHNRPA